MCSQGLFLSSSTVTFALFCHKTTFHFVSQIHDCTLLLGSTQCQLMGGACETPENAFEILRKALT